MINGLKNTGLKPDFKKISLFVLGFFVFLFVCVFYFINLSFFFWKGVGGWGHSLFVGGGVIASLFHRNELIIVFLDFLVFET